MSLLYLDVEYLRDLDRDPNSPTSGCFGMSDTLEPPRPELARSRRELLFTMSPVRFISRRALTMVLAPRQAVV